MLYPIIKITLIIETTIFNNFDLSLIKMKLSGKIKEYIIRAKNSNRIGYSF